MTTSSPSPRPNSWWREPEFWIALLLLAVVYLPRIATLPVRGEEPRRARVSLEMIEGSDWIVPREQGEPFTSRPPFHNWLIAASCQVLGNHGPVAIRLPSILAIFATAILLYGYGRSFLGRPGAFAAALIYPTAGEVLQFGRQAETEAVYAFLLGGSLILWHWGMSRSWPRTVTWSSAYALAAAAALCKGGLQPPAYLLGAIGAYLLYTRRWRELFSVGHLIGILVGAAPVAAWMFACADRVGWETTSQIWWGDTGIRFRNWRLGDVLGHMAVYPPVLFGSILPWSPFLAAYLLPRFRGALGAAGRPAVYHGVAAGLAFLTVWIPPGAATRYFAPLYPSLAILVAIVLDRCTSAEAPQLVRRSVSGYFAALGILTALVAVLVPFSPWVADMIGRPTYAPYPRNSWIYAIGAAIAAGLIWKNRQADSDSRLQRIITGVVLAMGALGAGILDDTRIRRAPDARGAVEELIARLPPGTQLVSIGHTDALFAYYYDRPIPHRGAEPEADTIAPGEYFCFKSSRGVLPDLPFPWVEVAAIPMDRFHRNPPDRRVIVARRPELVKPTGSP